MGDLLTVGIAAVAAAVGFLSGRLTHRSAPDLRPRCLCLHLVNEHEEDGGRCTVEVERDKYDETGEDVGWEYVRCACLRYTGPLPVTDALWTPPILAGDDGGPK